MDLFSAQTKRELTTHLPEHFSAEGLYISDYPENPLEVAVVASNFRKPTRNELLKLWRDRLGNRTRLLLLLAIHKDRVLASVCGPSGSKPPVIEDIGIEKIERIANAALNHSSRLSTQRFLRDYLQELGTDLLGIINIGMLAIHNLKTSAPTRKDWQKAKDNATRLAEQSGEDLLCALGYTVEKLDNLTKVLRSQDKRAALAVLLDEKESIEATSTRFNTMSPISYAMSNADNENIDWIIIVKNNCIRLYSAEVGKGVGRRGRTETYIECQPSLLSKDNIAYLWLLFSADALGKDGSLIELLESSERFAGDLAVRLRDRIYDKVVPNLAKGIVEAQSLRNPSRADLDLSYQMALVVLFRLLFIAYAEDRDLLPYQQSEAYSKRSLTDMTKELVEAVAQGTEIGTVDHYWKKCQVLFEAVNCGQKNWSVPPYGGDLFSVAKEISPAGAALKDLPIANEYFEAALRSLLVTKTDGEPGPVDFRSLGVREFGTIYEGLLEAELSVAKKDLKLDKNSKYVPVTEGKQAEVKAGEVYLHNSSGARKSSGSYYTKSFVVDYLVRGALEPALDDHFARLDQMNSSVKAAEAFFDFRVADIAMGSGHFLVAAVDRIEARMANYLKERQESGKPLTYVQQELHDLRAAAQKELGELRGNPEIEDGQLLRRQIARRCIYGVDLNPLAVQLARLSIWIHTFTPGLPLSLLDHNLVHGNALVGVGTVEEIRAKIQQMSGSLFEDYANQLLGVAAEPLKKLARLKDATPADIQAGRESMRQARRATRTSEALCDIITAQGISKNKELINYVYANWEVEKNHILTSNVWAQTKDDLRGMHAFHFPVQFPEVFLNDNPGFNVILGNPPWKEVTVEEDRFWIRHFPGLGGLNQREQENKKNELRKERPDLYQLYRQEREEHIIIRSFLVNKYAGMGKGDPDLYKAFCHRFVALTAEVDSSIAVVLPRSVFDSAGSEVFRRSLLNEFRHLSVSTLMNKAGWVFDNVHKQYIIALMLAYKSKRYPEGVNLSPQYTSFEEFSRSRFPN